MAQSDATTDPPEAERYQALFEQAAVGVALIDTITGRFLRINQKYMEILGYPEAMLRELDYLQISEPQDLPADLAEMARLHRGEIREFTLEKRLLRADGAPIWVLLTVSAMWAVGEPPRHHVAIIQDISARRHAEAASRAARAELEEMLSALPDLLFDLDDEGRIFQFHASSLSQLALRPEQFLHRRVRDLFPPDVWEVVHSALAEALATGRSTGKVYQLGFGGTNRSFELSVARRAHSTGRPRFVAIVRDITDRVELVNERSAIEAQLRQSQKMEAVGTLAGGIAHDFNNLIAIIGMNLALLRAENPPTPQGDAALVRVEGAVARAKGLVDQILTFSRRQPGQGESTLANTVVEQATELLRATIRRGIDIVMEPATEPAWVRADPGQLHQVLINLGNNARQAIIGETGTIRFTVERVELTRALGAVPPGSYVRMSVADDGMGMPPDLLERIFEPFFTTKAPSEGTGLGLSVAHRIVVGHGGTLTVDSTPGAGSTFNVYLPAMEAAEPTPVVDPEVLRPGEGVRVLYVDDEVSLLTAVLRLLEQIGYAATGHSDPLLALEVFRADPYAFDILVTDLNMPGLSGLALARAVRTVRPELPIVVASGYLPGDDELGAAGLDFHLAKPFQLAQLGKVLGAALGRSGR